MNQLTPHAAQRLKQRGIDRETLKLLRAFVRRVYDHRGGCRLVFDRRARARVRALLGKAAAQLKFSAYAVIDAARGDQVITVGHRTHRTREYA
jgi:hypothetical protein